MGEEKEADSPQPPSKLPRLSGADPNAGMCLCKRVLFFFERTCNRVCVQDVLISLACVFS